MNTDPEFPRSDPRADSGSRGGLLEVWFGMAAFGVLDFFFSFWAAFSNIGSGKRILAGGVFASGVAVLAALAYFNFGWKKFATGLVAGYVVMSLVSGGACTVLTSTGDPLVGATLYGLGLLLLFVAALLADHRK